MATPRVFISSTCYDLKYIRENLKFFIRTLGYESVLSEEGDVFYNPKMHTHDSCISEIENVQMFVLIIGGRFGAKFKDTEKSITNAEYENAIANHIPIFALVESGVYSDHFVFQKNKTNKSVNYPSVDNTKIFDFIDEVRKNAINNALIPFRDFADIEMYLKKQWAGMMHYFLVSESETKRVTDLLKEISTATQKIEFFTKNIATNTSDTETLTDIKLYDEMIGNDAIGTLSNSWKIKINPYSVLAKETFDEAANNKIEILADKGSVIYGASEYDNNYRLSQSAYEDKVKSYDLLRKRMISILEENGNTLENYLKKVTTANKVLSKAGRK